MLVANIKIWKSHLNIREGSDYMYACTFNSFIYTQKQIQTSFSQKPLGQLKQAFTSPQEYNIIMLNSTEHVISMAHKN